MTHSFGDDPARAAHRPGNGRAPLRAARRVPDPGSTRGVADARLLPDTRFDAAWSSIVLGSDVKERMLRTAVSGLQLRVRVGFDALPLHGITLLTGPPGVGKTSIARGLATRIASAVPDESWLFVEVDPHGLASSALGRSQQAVEQLFSEVLAEQAGAGPLVVLIDEVETLLTDRAALSMDANPVDVHRSVDAALVGLDRLARQHPLMVVLATSNFPGAIDPALVSRADQVVQVPLPDDLARRAIIEDSITALVAAFPTARGLATAAVLDAAALASAGLDGRRIRKTVAAACGRDPGGGGDPGQARPADLLAELAEVAASAQPGGAQLGMVQPSGPPTGGGRWA
jgi:SpoVK/Ycf46/Vps4 family AAA+-type ATPase